jgi:dihydrofolate reductase
VFIIGGAAIFQAALPMADRIYLTEVDAAPEGDVFFPALDTALWSEASSSRVEAGEGNDFAFTIRVLDHVTAPA